MLRRVTIRDFVLVDRLELDFGRGFGALTGETGAGKSILVDALAFALGERADTSLIRSGSERAEISAEFDLSDAPAAQQWLREQKMDDEAAAGESLLLRRVIDSNGRSRAYLNGTPATVQQVREIAESLVDIHGQHAHQSLLRSDAQRNLLDSHAKLTPLQEDVSAAWSLWRSARQQLEAASSDVEQLTQERAQLEWQVHELAALDFSREAWEQLNSEHKRLAHAASLLEGAEYSLALLTEGDAACERQIDNVARRLDTLFDYDPSLAEIAAVLQTVQTELGEAVSALRRYSNHLELDPLRLAEAEQRIEAVLSCSRKFRTPPEELPDLLARWQTRLSRLDAATDLVGLQTQVDASRQHYLTLANKLSALRLQAAQTLGSEVSEVMQQLALGGGRFEIGLIPMEAGTAYGLEQIEFRIAGLSGSEPRALAKVASGGELSRISLAIQVVTSQAACVPTLIFDEVDVGIGGGVAEFVGRLLCELGGERQVLCVTHLPQVAARANWQWQVAKESQNGTTTSHVLALDDQARIEEIARMLGGVEITAITRQHASEMLGLL